MTLLLAAVGAVVTALIELTVTPYLTIGTAHPHPVLVLGVIIVGTAYGVLRGRDILPTDRPLLIAGAALALLVAAGIAANVLRKRGALERLRGFARPLAGAPMALLSRTGVLMLAGTFVLWAFEGTVYLAVAKAIDLDISATGALYLVALTNFVAAVPAAPGSSGTFDAAVIFGARALGGAKDLVLAYALLLRFVLYVPITIVGLVVLLTRYGGLSALRSARLQTSRA